MGGYYLRRVAYALGSSCGFRLPVSRRPGAKHRAAGQGAVGKLLVTARGSRPRPGFVRPGERSEVLRKCEARLGQKSLLLAFAEFGYYVPAMTARLAAIGNEMIPRQEMEPSA